MNPHESIRSRLGDDVPGTLTAVANRYVGENPAPPFTFRAFSAAGILQRSDGRYDLNLGCTHPDAAMGGYAYACGRVYMDVGRTLELSLSCYGPTRIFLNGGLLYKSDVSEDVNLENRKVIPARLGAGWNNFVITLRETASGFGCRFGSNLPKWAPLTFLSPFAERAGRRAGPSPRLWTGTSIETSAPTSRRPRPRRACAGFPTWVGPNAPDANFPAPASSVLSRAATPTPGRAL